MTIERPARLTALIKRMPKDIREEFERMEAELAAANKKLSALDEASFSSPVGIYDHVYEGNAHRMIHRPLPTNRPIRFYRQGITPKERKGSENYVEFNLPREPDPRDEKDLIIQVSAGFNGVLMRPTAGNTFDIISKVRR